MKRKITITMTAIISAVSQILLPFAINSAYAERGYFAMGGEYALILLSLICMFICVENLIKMHIENIEMLRTQNKMRVRKWQKRVIKEMRKAG